MKGEIFIHNLFNSIKSFCSKYKSYIIVVVIIFFSILSIIIENINSKSKIQINNQEISLNEKEGKIAVYITGEVLNPGVYYVDSGSRIVDILEECGGAKETADLEEINLAQLLEDSDKIDIPKKVEQSDEENEVEEESSSSQTKVNINTASKDELKTLKGIGDTLAQNIIDYRKESKFEEIEDILNVNGIGESKYEAIKEYICVD